MIQITSNFQNESVKFKSGISICTKLKVILFSKLLHVSTFFHKLKGDLKRSIKPLVLIVYSIRFNFSLQNQMHY